MVLCQIELVVLCTSDQVPPPSALSPTSSPHMEKVDAVPYWFPPYTRTVLVDSCQKSPGCPMLDLAAGLLIWFTTRVDAVQDLERSIDRVGADMEKGSNQLLHPVLLVGTS